MRFHFGSFVMGWALGVATGPVLRRMRPLFVEIAGAVGELADSASSTVAQQRERLQDVLTEAKQAFRRPQHETVTPRRAATRAPRSRARATSRPASRTRRTRRTPATGTGTSA